MSGWAIAGQVAGDILSNIVNYASAKSLQDREFHAADTAHEREVADLKRAGLNPLYTTGTHGSTTPVLQPPTVSNPVRDLGNLVMQKEKNKAEIENMNLDLSTKRKTQNLLDQQAKREATQAQLNSALSLKTNMETGLQEELKYNAIQDRLLKIGEMGNQSAYQVGLKLENAKRLLEIRQGKLKQTPYNSKIGEKVLPWLDYATDKVGDIFGSIPIGIFLNSGKSIPQEKHIYHHNIR